MNCRAPRFTALIALTMLAHGALTVCASDLGVHRATDLELQIEGLGLLQCRAISGDRMGTLLLLKKQGGMAEVLETLDGFRPAELYPADLNSDQIPEVVLVGINAGNQEVFPFIYETRSGIKRLHPTNLGDYPVFGKEISLVALASGPALCVKIPYKYHDFGPPFLFREECYRADSKGLVKIQERTIPPKHFNQWANWGGLAFQKGDFLLALKRYELALNLKSEVVPADRLAEIRFFLAESRKFLKDFSTALADYQTVVLSFPTSGFTDKAQHECEFLAANLSDQRALSLYVDALALNARGKWNEALQFLRFHLEREKNAAMRDHLLFQQGEALLALGKLDEAVAIFRDVLRHYPETPLRQDIEGRLQEIEGNPDEDEGL